jgi:hypothetical protein
VSLINQALTAAGGAQAILAVKDYTATGSITYQTAHGDIPGKVKILGSGFSNFRLDATLPSGVRSEAVTPKAHIEGANGVAAQVHAQPPMIPSRYLLPLLLLAPVVNSSGYRVTYVGLVQVNGQSAHDIQIQRVLGGGAAQNELLRQSTAIDFFINPTTYEVVMMRDILFMGISRHSVREVQYSDYKPQGGVQVPFSIGEQLDSCPIRQIQLDRIAFNSGLQDSDFDIVQGSPAK